jgi:hypothetical protein
MITDDELLWQWRETAIITKGVMLDSYIMYEPIVSYWL